MANKPYKPKRNQDIYAKYDAKNSKKATRSDGQIKFFGFRSGASYKMIPAILYYAFALFYIVTAIYGEIKYLSFEPTDILLTILKYIFFTILMFSPLIFLSDFKYRDSLPFFKKRRASSSWIGIILVWMFCYFMVEVNIFAMTPTYKKSVNDYDAMIKKQQEERLKKQKQNETTTGETITIGESKRTTYDLNNNVLYI